MSYVQIQPGGKSNAKDAKYVNLAWNEWDSKRKRSVQRRFYVGRIAPDGEDVLLNKRFTGGVEVRVPLGEVRAHAGQRASFEAWLHGLAVGPAAADGVARVDIAGDAWLIRHLAGASGLETELVRVFGPDEGGALLGLAAHQFATGHALYRGAAWLSQREFPDTWIGPLVSESAVHGFVARVGADIGRREEFLERWVQRRRGSAAVVYDTTSVSSHSQTIGLAEWGYNRDDEPLRQVNFSLAATPQGMPLFYRVLPGSIPDVRTIAATLRIARDYGIERLDLSLDRGFYSAANLRELLGLDCGLVLGVPWSVAQAQALFKRHRTRLESPRHAFLHAGTPLRHVADIWRQDDATLAAHLFFNPARHAEAALRIEKQVFALVEKAARETFHDGREARTWIKENAGPRAPCLRVDVDEDNCTRVVPKPNRIAATTARAGYTLVLTRKRAPADEIPQAVLRDYRSRDLAEKLFDAYKTEHGQYRLRTTSDEGAQGRFFLGFAALVLRAELEIRMHDANLHKHMTDANVLDLLGKAKALVTRKGNRILLEISKKQRELLAALKVPELT